MAGTDFETRPSLPTTGARIFPFGFDFLLPFCRPFAPFVDRVDEADLVLAMNSTAPDAEPALSAARRSGKPIAFWTIEDPNWFDAFLGQAALADFVFTSDDDCRPRYRQRLGHDRIDWLPLACSPEFHHPLEPAADAADFVLSANWYDNEARRWGVRTVVDPLLASGRSLALYSYESFQWPPPYGACWRGHTHYRTTAEQYRHGRVVLGLNNQRSGLDGRGTTCMTSMRTFEALACGKPFLAAHSDAYERLGLIHGEHLASVRSAAETLAWADRLLGPDGPRIGRAGRELVLSRHTYAHRLARLVEVVLG